MRKYSSRHDLTNRLMAIREGVVSAPSRPKFEVRVFFDDTTHVKVFTEFSPAVDYYWGFKYLPVSRCLVVVFNPLEEQVLESCLLD